jgi:hypothetical protein
LGEIRRPIGVRCKCSISTWIRNLRPSELKLELLRKIASASIGEAERFLLTNCVETYLQLKGRAAAEYAALCAAQRTPEVETMRLTWAELR